MQIKKYKDNPFFIKFKAILLFIMVFAFLSWIYSFISIPKESAPQIDLPNYIVTTVYPWWDPKTIESQIIDRLEKEFSSISWLKEINSSSAFNIWIISLEFFKWKSKQDAINDIKQTIDKIKQNLPDGIEDPIVNKVSLDDAPIYTFSMVWNYAPSILYDKVKYLENDLKKIQWISNIVVVWKTNSQIKIIVDYEKINHYNIDFLYLINELQNLLKKIPIDKKNINWELFSFEVSSYQTNIDSIIDQIKNFNIQVIDWNIIKISDISNVYLSIEKETKKSFLYETNWNSLWAISFQIKKVAWADILWIIKEIKSYLSSQEEYLKKEDIKYYEILSQKDQIDSTYKTFISNFWQTSFFIFIIIIFFIWFRESLALAIAFPMVYLITFIILNLLWFSFNTIVSFSLILTLWIMVDSLIVITEWYDDWLKKWYTKIHALQYSINTYKKPLISWTITTIVMFIPLYFMLSWMMWEFMKAMPITIWVNLTISIIISLIFLPLIIEVLKSKKKKEKIRKKYLINRNVTNFVKPFLKTKKRAFLTIISFWLLFVFTIMLVVYKVIKIDFMSPIDSNNISVNINYNPWVDLEKNRELSYEITKKINDYLNQYYPNIIEYIWVDLWVKSSWDALRNTMYWTSWSDNYSTLTIKLVDKDKKRIHDGKKYKAYTIKENIQNFVNNNIKNKYLKEILVTSDKAWPWSWKPIKFNIIWNDIKEISKYIDKILPKLEEINWSFNWWNSIEYTNWKLRIIWDYNKLKEHWITTNRLNLLLMWIKNTQNYIPNWITIDKLYDITNEELSIKTFLEFNWNLENLKISWVYLSQFIKEIQFLPELKTIDHLNSNIVINVDADQIAWIPLSIITDKIDEIISKNPLPNWISFSYWSDIKEQQNSWKDMWFAFWVWLILMFWVLVYQFNNFKYPLLIMSSLPLLIIWAFWLLGLLWQTFSFASQIWIFWLIWVWVNTSILLIESYKDKMKKDKIFSVNLLYETINSRVKPIFLTTITTVIWLTTLALKDELWAWLAIAFMWGLIFSTIIVWIYLSAVLRLINKEKIEEIKE